MTTALIFTGIIAFLAGWHFFLYKLSGSRPWWNPLWLAFMLTAAALLYGTAGLIGYKVPLEMPFVGHPAVWVGHVVWPQVEMATAMGLIPVLPWRQGLKRL
jgi:hypothetical protein